MPVIVITDACGSAFYRNRGFEFDSVSGQTRRQVGQLAKGVKAAKMTNKLALRGSTNFSSSNISILPKPSCGSKVILQRISHSSSSRSVLLKIAPKSDSPSCEVISQRKELALPEPNGLSSEYNPRDFRNRQDIVANGSNDSDHHQDNGLQMQMSISRCETSRKAPKSSLASQMLSVSFVAHSPGNVEDAIEGREGFTLRDSAVDSLTFSSYVRIKEEPSDGDDPRPYKKRKTSTPSHSAEPGEHASTPLTIDSRQFLTSASKSTQLDEIPSNTRNSLPSTKVFSKLLKRAGDVLEQSVFSSLEEPLDYNVNMRLSGVLELAFQILTRAKLPPVFNMPSNFCPRDPSKKPVRFLHETSQMKSRERSVTENEDVKFRPDTSSEEAEMGKLMCPLCIFVSYNRDDIINHVSAKHY
ncbi:hypothetical protein Aperf_G00000116450 [Anoplocephala perfoliata]